MPAHRRAHRARSPAVGGFTLPPLIAAGTSPPAVTLTGVGNDRYQFVIAITTGGALGTAVFEWSSNGGATYTTSVATAATVTLGSTGVTANFPSGTYSTNNVYTSSMIPVQGP